MSKNSLKKDGTRYYKQTDLWRLLGAGMMIVGIIWFWLGYSMASYYVPCVITPAGLVLFLIFSSRHISDNDMEEERNHRLLDYDASVTSRNDYSRLVLKQPADVETEAYHMGGEATCFKRGKNSALVSDRYVKTHFFFTANALLVCSRALSMTLPVEDERAVTDTELTLPYESIRSVELCEQNTTVTLTNTKKPATARWMELVVSGSDGELLRLPVKNDMDVATLCDELNRRLEQPK